MEKISIVKDGVEYRVFDHLYAVSCTGKALRKFKPVTPNNSRNDGYLTLGRQRLLHRVVASCWCDKPNGASHVHHINGVKTDNRAENLEWVTPKQHLTERHDISQQGKYVRSEATRQKIRDFRTGKKDSETTRKQKAKVLAKNRPKSSCRYNGVEYPSVSAGARAAGIPAPTFRLRCISKNFPDYELIKPFYS